MFAFYPRAYRRRLSTETTGVVLEKNFSPDPFREPLRKRRKGCVCGSWRRARRFYTHVHGDRSGRLTHGTNWRRRLETGVLAVRADDNGNTGERGRLHSGSYKTLSLLWQRGLRGRSSARTNARVVLSARTMCVCVCLRRSNVLFVSSPRQPLTLHPFAGTRTRQRYVTIRTTAVYKSDRCSRGTCRNSAGIALSRFFSSLT